MSIRYEETRPTAEDYNALRRSVNWSVYDKEPSEKAIAASLHFICAYDGDELVGMGRITGDGCLCFYICDVIVRPEYQGNGVGRMVMDKLITYARENAADKGQITLNAMLGKEGFYEKLGFFIRPTEKYGPGMSMFVDKKGI